MATTQTRRAGQAPDPDFDGEIEQIDGEYGRHNARFSGSGPELRAVLNALRRADGTVAGGNVAEVAAQWRLPESSVRAAMRYYERYRDLFDASFLLQDEEWNAWNHG